MKTQDITPGVAWDFSEKHKGLASKAAQESADMILSARAHSCEGEDGPVMCIELKISIRGLIERMHKIPTTQDGSYSHGGQAYSHGGQAYTCIHEQKGSH